MVDYYCDVTDHLSMLKKILVDGGCTGEKLADAICEPVHAYQGGRFLISRLELLRLMSRTG